MQPISPISTSPMRISNDLCKIANTIELNIDDIPTTIQPKVYKALASVSEHVMNNSLSNTNLQDAFMREVILSSKVL